MNILIHCSNYPKLLLNFSYLDSSRTKAFNIKADDRVLQFASISFDASIWEIVMALIAGASLYLGTRNTLLPGTPLIKFLRTQ
jgi:non-ribosomal peptide synthetase component F